MFTFMPNYLRRVIYFTSLLLLLAACGGGGGGSSPQSNTDCVLGSSSIGECKI